MKIGEEADHPRLQFLRDVYGSVERLIEFVRLSARRVSVCTEEFQIGFADFMDVVGLGLATSKLDRFHSKTSDID